MKTPERSAALARVLAVENDGLPDDFATHVAALAQASGTTRRSSWSDVALLGAFVAMICVCVAGWSTFGSRELPGEEWVTPIVDAVRSQPWLVIGVVGVAIVQALTFRRRTTI
jgi:hypothetical protein